MPEKKYEYFQTGMSEKGIIHITMMKNWVNHILYLRITSVIAAKQTVIRVNEVYDFLIKYRYIENSLTSLLLERGPHDPL